MTVDVHVAEVGVPTAPRAWLPWARRLAGAVLIGLALAAAIDRRHQLAEAGQLLGRLNWGWLGVAIALEIGSLVAFARLQRWLLRAGGVHVGLGAMFEITLAGNALAMSLPGGAAWAAAWAFGQLRRRGADRLLAGWVVLVAGALASFALFLLLVAGALVAGSKGPVASLRPLGLALAAIPAVAAALFVAAHRSSSVREVLGAVWRGLGASRRGRRAEEVVEGLVDRIETVRPPARAWLEAFGLALANWLEAFACLVACILAVHGHVPWRGVLVAYALTQVAASVPITPGGLGVVEGSLTALLMAYGLAADVALASVLLFRAVSFWGLVPLGWGAWASLTLAGRRGGPRRPHPWAVHRHRRLASVPAPDLPDRLFPPEPCDDCDECEEIKPVKLTRAG